ncbi:hypothetical protein [Cystobacter fuscus]|uniref:hypothetical protein n=1 Tax=Cystobacter fuscus TaxID=43 RepID=UPI002B2A9AB7|nr:hypothetical protein F0U63_46125 [Cystobacter fuscus]
MGRTPGKKGDRIGPYRLGRRYRGTDPGEGAIHEAHHVETGAPALVVLPGENEDGRPRSAWSVRAEGSIHPPYQAVHVEQTPQGRASLHDLTLLLIRLAGATAHIENRKDARAHFTRVRFYVRLRRQVLRWGLAGAAAAGVALALRPHAPEPMETRAAIDEPIAFTNRPGTTPPFIGYPMPEAPFKEQARPPCIPDAEVEIRGGCWTPHARTAPCPRSTAEYQGKCYVPVKKPEPTPNSLQP